ncbi:hypothetical protein SELMODRAFT_127254, partial [Selaginella moellendorffii]
LANVSFRNLLGRLMYTMVYNYLDLAYVIIALSQFFSNLSKKHWDMAKSIMHHVK